MVCVAAGTRACSVGILPTFLDWQQFAKRRHECRRGRHECPRHLDHQLASALQENTSISFVACGQCLCPTQPSAPASTIMMAKGGPSTLTLRPSIRGGGPSRRESVWRRTPPATPLRAGSAAPRRSDSRPRTQSPAPAPPAEAGSPNRRRPHRDRYRAASNRIRPTRLRTGNGGITLGFASASHRLLAPPPPELPPPKRNDPPPPPPPPLEPPPPPKLILPMSPRSRPVPRLCLRHTYQIQIRTSPRKTRYEQRIATG